MSDSHGLRDDPLIPDEEGLYRCIHQRQLDSAEDRPSSATFKSKTNPHPSVDRASLSTPEQSLARKPDSIGVACLTAGVVRECTVGIASDPLPDNTAHAVIIRDLKLSDSHWNRTARKLAKGCTWALRRNS